VRFTGEEGIRYVIRAAPLTVTPALSHWSLTRRAADVCKGMLDTLIPLPFAGGPGGAAADRTGPWIEPQGRAVVARLTQAELGGSVDSATMVADSGGVIAIELRRGYDPPVVMVEQLLDAEIRPLVKTLASSLDEAEAVGRTIADLWIIMSPEAGIGGRQRAVPAQLHVSGELTVPATDDEIEALALAWHREIQRTIGIVKYERD
jgi:hypothetical protein